MGATLVNLLRIMLFAKAGALVAKILLFFGLAWSTMEFAVDPLISQIEGMINTGAGSGGMGAAAMQWMGVLKFDKALSMILSAYTAAWSIRSFKAFLGKVDM